MIQFITGSAHKFGEIRAIIPELEQLQLNLPEIQEIDAHKIVATKLKVAMEYHKGPLMVEDTSLYLECLGGLPGPLVKWFEQTMHAEGIAKMAIALGDARATARTLIGYADERGNIHFFEGMIEGTLVLPRVPTDFGWNNIFMPNGYDLTFEEISKEEKNKISMRGIAARNLKAYLDARA
jgi:inosine triphosphate pyrophosphatase